jgi:hypothetical protein
MARELSARASARLFAEEKGPQKVVLFLDGQLPAGDGHELVFKDRAGGRSDEKLQFPDSGEAEIPTYLHAESSAFVTQI